MGRVDVHRTMRVCKAAIANSAPVLHHDQLWCPHESVQGLAQRVIIIRQPRCQSLVEQVRAPALATSHGKALANGFPGVDW